jgi:hypothetical protein
VPHSAADRRECLTLSVVLLMLHSSRVVRQGCAGWIHPRAFAGVVNCGSIPLYFYTVIITLSIFPRILFWPCTDSVLYSMDKT